MMFRLLSFCALALSLFTSVAAAEPVIAEKPGYWDLRWDNDSFNRFGEATDRWFTNGLRLERVSSSAASAQSRFWSGARDWICGLVCGKGWDNGVMNEGWSLGQNIYTPQNIRRSQPQPFDRPWAGWLYYGRSLQQTYLDGNLGLVRQDRLELSLGVVGPMSLASGVQIGWHDLWGFQRPNGWSNQLRNEPAILLNYETRVSLLPPQKWAALIPYAGVSLGNVLTAANLGATLRLGYNAPGLGSVIDEHAAVKALGEFPGGGQDTPRADWSVYLFGRGDVRAVAQNIFLDGNSFRHGPSVDKEPLVYELSAGAGVVFPFGLMLTYEYIHRSKEFNTPGFLRPEQNYGSIHLGWRIMTL